MMRGVGDRPNESTKRQHGQEGQADLDGIDGELRAAAHHVDERLEELAPIIAARASQRHALAASPATCPPARQLHASAGQLKRSKRG